MSLAGDRDFFRRVAAVLVAEPDASVPPGDDDASAVADALEILRRAGGDAEPLVPGAVVAVFDEPGAAVTGATRLHLGAAAAGGRTIWRAGLDVGDVLIGGDASNARAALDQAVALARQARPGTTAVARSALPTLGRVHDARVEPLDRGVPEGPVHLIVPHWPSAVARRRRALVLIGGVAALGALGGVVWIASDRRRRDERRLTLGVGLFRSSGGNEASAWMGPALRDGLNTQLSELTGVRVFSDEFIDFLMNREHLTAIEVATRLGIERMVSGTVVVVGDTVQVEARIIDVATGVFEDAYVATGRQQDLLALEQDLTLGVIGKLHLRLSPDEERRLAARRTTSIEALRRVLDVEQQPRPAPPSPSGLEEPHSSPWQWVEPRSAHADEATAEITRFLEAYGRATEARDMAAIAALYVEFLPTQRAALERFFRDIGNLRVKIERVEVAAVGDDAVVSYTRTDDFTDIPTDVPQHVSIRVTKTLRRVAGGWRFAVR